MRILFIISIYPNTESREKILIESISSVKSSNSDVMLISHLPISKEIRSLVNYYIFDTYNTFLPKNMTANTWFDTDFFKITIYSGGHVVPISRNMYHSIKLAKCLDYDFFYFMESDNIISPKDLDTLMLLAKEVIDNNKIALFFKPENFMVCGSYVYETLLFGGSANRFLTSFTPPSTVEEWVKMEMGYTLELAMFEKLGHLESEFMVFLKHSYEVLTSSKINLFRYNLYISEVADNLTDSESPALFVANLNPTGSGIRAVVYKNSELLLDDTLIYNSFKLFHLSLNDDIIDVKIFENNILDSHKIFVLNRQNINGFSNNAQIEFKHS